MFESENEIMSVSEVAEVLHVGLNTVYRLIKGGELDAFRTGTRSWHIHRTSLEKYVCNSIRKK